MEEEKEEAIVMIFGSGTTQVGINGDAEPQTRFSTVIGRPRINSTARIEGKTKEFYVGDEAQDNRNILNLNYPIKHGIVTNWEDMEIITHYIYDEILHKSPEMLPVLLSEVILNPKLNRERLAQMFFEKFSVPELYIFPTSCLVHYPEGRTTSINVEMGDGVITVVPIYEGFMIKTAIKRQDFAGRNLTEYLAELLTKRGYHFATNSQMEIVREIKEKLCYVSTSYETELKSPEILNTIALPDGQTIELGTELFQCPESLFKPSLAGQVNLVGIHMLIYNSLMNCDIDCRADLFFNILLTGGTAKLPNLAERISSELSCLLPETKRVRVRVSQSAEYATWRGGSMQASLSTMKGEYITRQEYEESGPFIVHRDCI